MTLVEVYQLEKNKPNPAQVFIAKVAEATCREETTVRQWLSGQQQPSPRAKERIAALLDMPVNELFPQSDNDLPDEEQ